MKAPDCCPKHNVPLRKSKPGTKYCPMCYSTHGSQKKSKKNQGK